jgi:methylisocitrate lyase
MSWLVTAPVDQAESARWLRDRVQAAADPLTIPGAHDALTALLAKAVGFECLYLSGAAYSASRGLPDVGMVTSSEVAERARDIVRATQLPLIVDIDTGYGSPLSAARSARELAEAGIAAVQVEDQQLPKACGHLTVERLAPVAEVAGTIRAIREAAPEMVIVGRTDARTLHGVEGVIERAVAMRGAGADIIFPEALRSRREFRQVREGVEGPLLANMTEFGRSPALTVTELANLGYTATIFPVSSLRVSAQAALRLYQSLLGRGSTSSETKNMLTRAELYDLLAYSHYAAFDTIISDMIGVADNASTPPGWPDRDKDGMVQ